MSGHVVMIHGAFAGPWCLQGWADRFHARGWQCHLPVLRHHGSPPGDAPPALGRTGLKDYLADLAELADSLPEAPVVLGHSLGGLLAQQLAARGRVRAAVLLTPAPAWGTLPASRDEIAAALGLMGLGAFWTQAVHPSFDVARGNSLASLPEATQRAVFDRCVPESGRALFEMLFWMFDAHRASYVRSIDVACPVLAVAAEDGRLIAPESVRQTAERYPEQATFACLSNFGHMLPLEPGWEGAADFCLDWLEGLPA